jgi:hypothetical protein
LALSAQQAPRSAGAACPQTRVHCRYTCSVILMSGVADPPTSESSVSPVADFFLLIV